MRSRALPVACVLFVLGVGTGSPIEARAQGSVSEGTRESLAAPGAGDSLFGGSPGAPSGPGLGDSGQRGTQADQQFLGASAGISSPRVPQSVAVPGGTNAQVGTAARITLPSVLPSAELPIYGSLTLPEAAEDAGPTGGLTLDQAIDLLIRDNLTLRALAYEIPQAQADILTASLRANPILFADAQLVPYGNYSEQRPGGPVQYDVNVTLPLDISHKRQARMNVAGRAKQVLEAQYQDAVRVQVANLYTAFVDVLAARETVRFSRASLEGLDALLEPLEKRLQEQLITESDVNSVRIQRELAAMDVQDSEETLQKSLLTLCELLNRPAFTAADLAVRGKISLEPPALPDDETLVGLAIQNRPDLAAFRLGVMRAQADVQLAHANKWSDVFWLVQPYTFQDNAPYGRQSAHSWATGVTVPLPLQNRNQGNIRRAQLNVTQTQVELAALEQRIATEVRQARKDLLIAQVAVMSMKQQVLPAASQILRSERLKFDKGEVDIVTWRAALRQYNDVVKRYRDLLIRQRRGMLQINTSVAQRLFP